MGVPRANTEQTLKWYLNKRGCQVKVEGCPQPIFSAKLSHTHTKFEAVGEDDPRLGVHNRVRLVSDREIKTVTLPTSVCSLHAVLTIHGMPIRLRRTVEDAMVECIQSPADYAAATFDDVFASEWFTQWRRTAPGLIGCRQVITGDAHELAQLSDVLDALGREHGFHVSVD